jgi:DNA-binding NtrC family response regulator
LREHKEDIPDLVSLFLARQADEFARKITGVSPAAMKLLMEHHWPGNVRELQNVMERAAALAAGPVLEASDVHIDSARAKPADSVNNFLPEGMTLEHWEDEMIREALRRANGNKSQAARLLGLSRNALRYRLSKIGLDNDPDEGNDSGG